MLTNSLLTHHHVISTAVSSSCPNQFCFWSYLSYMVYTAAHFLPLAILSFSHHWIYMCDHMEFWLSCSRQPPFIQSLNCPFHHIKMYMRFLSLWLRKNIHGCFIEAFIPFGSWSFLPFDFLPLHSWPWWVIFMAYWCCCFGFPLIC